MLTMTPEKEARKSANVHAVTDLPKASEVIGRVTLGGTLSDGKRLGADALVFRSSNDSLTRWLETEYKEEDGRPADINLQIEYLKRVKHEISSWLIIAPQRRKSFGDPVSVVGIAKLAVKHRIRNQGGRFQVFGESPHRDLYELAHFLCGHYV